jgi:RimJ/RimL family protein N-acetyltransferase
VAADEITFEPLTEADLPLIHRWLNDPGVAEWYGVGLENVRNPPLEMVVEHYTARARGETPTKGYTIRVAGVAAGYIQAYRIGDWADYARALDHDDDAVGIDLFIGEATHRDRGLGAPILSAFLRAVVFQRPGVERAIIAPEPENARAVRCYEKAGFGHVKTVFIEESGEHEYVMDLTLADFRAGEPG